MGNLGDLEEKTFIRETLGHYASTARKDRFDDCVVVDLSEVLGNADLPYFVYSMDHPSQIRRPLPKNLRCRFFGRWVAACTCGDVLAMGAQPKGFSLDFAAPTETEVSVVRQIYDGLSDVVSHYEAELQGGNFDTNSRLELVGFCWGIVDRDRIVRRTGARRGDYIAVTGELGTGWSSYLLYDNGRVVDLEAQSRSILDNYNLMPVAPHRAILETVREVEGGITSGMDLTDGPIEFFYNILERDGLGARVEEESIPVSPLQLECAKLLEVPPTLLSLDPGYDTPRVHGYTINPQHWDRIQRTFRRYGTAIHRIGEVTERAEVVWLSSEGDEKRIPRFWADQLSSVSVIDRWFGFVEEMLSQ